MGGFEFQLNDALKFIKKIHKAKIKLTNGKPNTFWRHISKLTLHITSTAKAANQNERATSSSSVATTALPQNTTSSNLEPGPEPLEINIMVLIY